MLASTMNMIAIACATSVRVQPNSVVIGTMRMPGTLKATDEHIVLKNASPTITQP